MDSVKTRKLFLSFVLLPLTGALAGYGLLSPIPGSGTASIVLASLAAALFLGVRAAEGYDPHQLNLVEEKSYRITLKSSVATAFLTGITLLAVLYAAAAVIGVVTAFWGYETFSFQLFADAVGRLQIILEVPLNHLLGAYAGAAVIMGTGFWTLYPYFPTENEELAGPVSFLASGIFLLAATAMFEPLPISSSASLALDAAIIAFWGHFFAVAYEEVERYVP